MRVDPISLLFLLKFLAVQYVKAGNPSKRPVNPNRGESAGGAIELSTRAYAPTCMTTNERDNRYHLISDSIRKHTLYLFQHLSTLRYDKEHRAQYEAINSLSFVEQRKLLKAHQDMEATGKGASGLKDAQADASKGQSTSAKVTAGGESTGSNLAPKDSQAGTSTGYEASLQETRAIVSETPARRPGTKDSKAWTEGVLVELSDRIAQLRAACWKAIGDADESLDREEEYRMPYYVFPDKKYLPYVWRKTSGQTPVDSRRGGIAVIVWPSKGAVKQRETAPTQESTDFCVLAVLKILYACGDPGKGAGYMPFPLGPTTGIVEVFYGAFYPPNSRAANVPWGTTGPMPWDPSGNLLDPGWRAHLTRLRQNTLNTVPPDNTQIWNDWKDWSWLPGWRKTSTGELLPNKPQSIEHLVEYRTPMRVTRAATAPTNPQPEPQPILAPPTRRRTDPTWCSNCMTGCNCVVS